MKMAMQNKYFDKVMATQQTKTISECLIDHTFIQIEISLKKVEPPFFKFT